jgi:hypothetical protein
MLPKSMFTRLLGFISVIAVLGLGAQAIPRTALAQGAPTVHVTSPSNGATLGNPVTIAVETSGAVIKDASAGDPNAAHLHYFIDRDPATVLQPGQPIPSGQADIIHTPNTTEALPNLSPGAHTVWVVLAHTDHTPYSPNVQDRVTFTVGTPGAATAASTPAAPAAPSQLPAGGTGGLLSQSADDSPLGTMLRVVTTIAIGSLVLAGGLMLYRRPGRGRR